MQAILLSIGDELALGQTVDTNSAWLAGRLAGLGIPTLLHETVSDDRGLIAAALSWAAGKADLVLVSGGLGPTEDDLTRQALADAMGVELVEDPASLEALEAFFRGRGYAMAARNRVQALCPRGASMLANPAGTAPGIRARLGRAEVFVTPGVPREMKAMFEAVVLPFVQKHAGAAKTILTTKVNTFGLGESDVAEKLGDLMDRGRNPTVGTTVSGGLCSVRVRSESDDPRKAQDQINDTVNEVEACLGPLVFGVDDQTLQGAVVRLLDERGQTLATAESCTGGLIGGLVTDVPGSSGVYAGGWVTYADAMKSQQLGVPPETIDRHGAVSEAVVVAMARGARERSGADLAVSVSGIAGPGGGTQDKPVGTVWFGLASPEDTVARCARLVGDRAAVRDRAAKCALQMIRLALLGEPLDRLRWFKAD